MSNHIEMDSGIVGRLTAGEFKNRLLVILDKYRDLGEITFPNGTMSIGKIPGKEKWFLVHLYGGLKLDQIDDLERWISKPLPAHLRRFYSMFNGMTVFGAGQFQLWGHRGPPPEGMPNYQPIPFFTAHPDTCAELRSVPEGAIFFGGYSSYSSFYVTSDSEVVYACTRLDATPIAKWPSIEAMVLDVVERLSKWFDANAQPIDPAVNERPVLFEKISSH